MKKWLMIVFVVSWAIPPSSNIVPCPNSQSLTTDKGSTVTGACIETKTKEERAFKTKKEAEDFKKFLEMFAKIFKAEIVEKK